MSPSKPASPALGALACASLLALACGDSGPSGVNASATPAAGAAAPAPQVPVPGIGLDAEREELLSEVHGLRAERAELLRRIEGQLEELVHAREDLVASEVELAGMTDELDYQGQRRRELEQRALELEQERDEQRQLAALLREEAVRLEREQRALERRLIEQGAELVELRALSELPSSAGAQPVDPDGELVAVRKELEEARAVLRLTLAELERTHQLEQSRTAELTQALADLAREREQRVDRELEWLAYNRLVQEIDIEALTAQLGFPIHTELLGLTEETGDAGREVPDEPPDPAVERAGVMTRTLSALLRAEQTFGLEPLELGRVHELGCGPVVFRMLDDRGRLSGSLVAERLHLEASRAGRSVTLVLSQGHESRGGEEFPFHRGVRRITLHHVDPEDWIGELPELFIQDGATALRDDGRWDRGRVRQALNQLLRRDAAGGYYQLRHLEGVRDGVLLYVSLYDYDRQDRVRRHVAADRMILEESESGLLILLEDGTTIRGDQTAPFLDGRMRIYLPRARIADWRAAQLPGLSEPPPRNEQSE